MQGPYVISFIQMLHSYLYKMKYMCSCFAYITFYAVPDVLGYLLRDLDC